MSFCTEILKIETHATLEAHNLVWKPPIEVKSKAKLGSQVGQGHIDVKKLV
jgi:hypothetical protein